MAIEAQNVEIDGQPINTTVTNFPSTQPVSGTVTSEIVGHAGATLDGTAGSPSTGVLTVQGVAGGTAVPISGTVTTTSVSSNTSTITQVTLTANTNATLLAANSSRKKFILFVPKSVTYVKYGTTASATSFTWTAQSNNVTIDDTIWTGEIDILSTVAQTVTVTELV